MFPYAQVFFGHKAGVSLEGAADPGAYIPLRDGASGGEGDEDAATESRVAVFA